MSINTLLDNPYILNDLASLIAPETNYKIQTYTSQLTTTGNSITLQNQTLSVTSGLPMYVALSFSFGGLSTGGTATATVSTAVNGGTAQTSTFPVASALVSNLQYAQTLYYTFTNASNSANIVSTVSSTASLSGAGGICSMLVIYK